MLSEYVIPVPGTFADDEAFLDIETRKVPVGRPFKMRNGETLRMRWQVFMAAVARSQEIILIEHAKSEDVILDRIAELVAPYRIIGYSAGRREFDEMVLKGKFTNARRAHELQPFYPAMPGAEDFTWINYRRGIRSNVTDQRLPDVESAQVPLAAEDGRMPQVLVHMLRDVVEVILDCGLHDSICKTWCENVITRPSFASDQIFMDELDHES